MKLLQPGDLKFFQFGNLSNISFITHAISSKAFGNLKENREKFFSTLGVLDKDVVQMNQVHGNHVAIVGKSERGHTISKTDGVITGTPGIVLFVRVADCVPILLVDPVKGVVGVIHAGWRGTAQEIARLTLDHMEDHFGTRAEDVIAGIGPSIGPCCYEVDTPVIEAFNKFPYKDKLFSKKHGVHASLAKDGKSRRANLDLWNANKFQLIEKGVREKNIEVSNLCTYENPQLFFSDRREKKSVGRFGAVLFIK